MTGRSTPSTLPGEGGRIPVTDNGTDAYKPSWGGVRREASPSLPELEEEWRSVNRNARESPEPRSVPGSLFLLRSSLLIGPPALFSFAPIHRSAWNESSRKLGATRVSM